jgi:hypothetical protein
MESTYFYFQYNIMDYKSQDVVQYFRSIYRVFVNIAVLSYAFTIIEGVTVILVLFYTLINLQNFSSVIEYIKRPMISMIVLSLITVIVLKFQKWKTYLEKSIIYQINYIKIKRKEIEKEMCPARAKKVSYIPKLRRNRDDFKRYFKHQN